MSVRRGIGIPGVAGSAFYCRGRLQVKLLNGQGNVLLSTLSLRQSHPWICRSRRRSTATPIVRNVDGAIVKVLKERARPHGGSAEAEHRKILKQVLLQLAKKSFAKCSDRSQTLVKIRTSSGCKKITPPTMYWLDTSVINPFEPS
ncbi:FitA-like ribbon-helix-helix domain-containing protein [Synechococcus sp. W60.2]|uniref:FitA-like ribbon-helix-helix domain-containing protein n=1 Tax=unclassified Synechococcus TaxID=2626047 RepID=UPI0039C38B72